MAIESVNKLSSSSLLEHAKEAEAEGKLEEAARLYEQLLKGETRDEFPFDRLMILYRKLKKYKDELRVINKGIRVFEAMQQKPVRKSSEKHEKLSTLSNAFMKRTGLQDKKGNLVYIPEPIARWMKRKKVVENKLK